MMTRDELKKKIATIVVLLLENRSFDHVLGHLAAPQYGARPDVDGIDDLDDPAYLNPNSAGVGISPFWTGDRAYDTDFPHERDDVAAQLMSAGGVCAMNGFVKVFEQRFHTEVARPGVMGLLDPSGAPVTTALANHYTVCDRWFACLPTSTSPNRLMSMCGYTDIDQTGTLIARHGTVYEWLIDQSVRWRVYSAGLPWILLMPTLFPLVLTTHFRRLEALEDDLAQESDDDWPQVIFIEPDYYDSPLHLALPCDNHPPLGMARGEALLRQVYDALSSHPRWKRTVFIVTYDEHGGFFDHVAPLRITYRNAAHRIAFDCSGPRVPAVVTGPFAPRGATHEWLDNTSILQLIAERFGRNGADYSPAVSARLQQGIKSVSAVLSATAKNGKRCPFPALPQPATKAAPLAKTPHNAMREGFHQAIASIADKHRAEAYKKYPEIRKYLSG